MSRIILCGASAVGKTTLARDWCYKNREYELIGDVRKDVVRTQGIDQYDLERSLSSHQKKLFFEHQRLIFEEQNLREIQVGEGFCISERGPEPLVDTFLESQAEAEELSNHEAVKECLYRYRGSLVVLVCPLENTADSVHQLGDANEEKYRFTAGLHEVLRKFDIPYMYLGERNRQKRLEILKIAVEGTAPITIDQFMDQRCLSFYLDTETRRKARLPPPFLPLPRQGKEARVRTFDLNPSEIILTYPPMDSFQTNRMVDRYGEENFVLLQFHAKLHNSYIRDVLRQGIYVNGEEYQFLGCSSSGLKGRKCYMLKGRVEDVTEVLEQCGNFKKIKMVSKRLKRISQLFSVAIKTGVIVPDDKVEVIDDIETPGGNFTDGCGSVGLNLAAKLAKGCDAFIESPEDGIPTVFQIRFHGCKGIIVKNPTIDKDSIQVRDSMKKFMPGTRPFPEVWVCEHSRPYSYGHLNKQYIMLLSGLGIKDEIFLDKQADFLRALENMLVDPTLAITILYWRNRPDLAAFVAECKTSEELAQDKIQLPLRFIRSKLILKLEKLSIPVMDSRTLFGVCDPLGLMDYGECFVRISVQGQAKTLQPGSKVTVGKNPCYLLGDVRVLTAVDHPELHHLIDCIVFPVKGKNPHSAEIAGSDLDGDQYFVCWDKDLIPPHIAEPYDYPSVEAHPSDTVTREMMIDYFSGQKNMMGKINDYFQYWADIKGPGCYQCEQLGAWFSRSVDSSKTGDIVRIPYHLIPPRPEPENPSRDAPERVWLKMQKIAAECNKRLTEEAVEYATGEDQSASFIAEEFIRNLLEDTNRGISEYKLFCLVYKWCDVQDMSKSKKKEKLIELSDYINFGLLTMNERIEAIELGIPIGNVMNALNKSRLLDKEMLLPFYMDIPACGWKFFFRESTTSFDWRNLFYALTRFPETLLVLQLPKDERLAFHLIGPFEEGESVIPPGSVVSYFFSPRFRYKLRYVTECNYNLNLTESMIQLYRNNDVINTFLWLKSQSQDRRSQYTEYDRISIDLTRFKRTIRRVDRHPLIQKETFQSVEVFVKTQSIEDIAYFDIHETEQDDQLFVTGIETSDVLEELPSEEEGEKEEADVTLFTPFSPDTSLIAMQEFAKKGDFINFKKVITLIPKPTTELPEPVPRTKLTEEVLNLMTNLVVRSSHKQPSDAFTEELNAIFNSPYISIPSPKDLLLLFTCLTKLQLFDMIAKHSENLIDKLELSTLAQYFECIFHWERWSFLSLSTACELSDRLYILARKLDSVRRPPADTTQDGEEAETATPDSIQNLVVTAYADPPPLDERDLNQYKCYYAYLMLKHLLAESPGKEEYNSVKDTENSVCMLRVLHSQDKRVNVELQSSSDEGASEGTAAAPEVQKKRKKKKKKKSPTWKACFSRINKLTFSKFSIGSYVKIRLMNRPNSLHSKDPIALGCISALSKSPADIVVDIAEPVPQSLKRSADVQIGYWCLTLLGNVTSFKRASKALQSISTPGIISILISPEAFPPEITADDNEPDFEAAAPEQVQLPGRDEPITNPYRAHDGCAGCEYRARTRFNPSQENAISAALTQRLTLIHGPPGTGKTFVTCEIVHQLVHKMRAEADGDNKCKILVAAETNNAVDNLTQKLVTLNMRVVRVGKKNQIAKHLHDYSLEHQVDMKRIQLGQDKRGEFQSPKLKREILNSVDIIATTCTGAGDADLKTINFSYILIDEATQAIEPVSLISIAKSCEKLILIGDPKQLAPTLPNTRSSTEHICPLEVPRFEALCQTLFHRLHSKIKSFFLEEQHRMHPYIADFPSRVFYSGMLKTAVLKEDRVPPQVGFLSREKPVVFIDVDSPEFHTASSYKNSREADVVVDVIKQLMKLEKYKLSEIAILTPYTGQVRCLKEKLELIAKVEVSSIDGFQGKEKEIIIFSTVRNNGQGVLGFTDSPYRINVSLTRAKCALIGVGNAKTLSLGSSQIWKHWTQQFTVLTEEEFYEEHTPQGAHYNENNNNSMRGRRDDRARYKARPFSRDSSRGDYRREKQVRNNTTIGSFVSARTLQAQRNMKHCFQMSRTSSQIWGNVPVHVWTNPPPDWRGEEYAREIN